ncbi:MULTISPECIES: DUF1836 domain-containing protein [Clostridium]|uniref:DUF1836 domain-containing protein n=3 Tax=Clostridium TaxID=1485 RepID=D8GKR3_CLOLD|nr:MULTISPECIES: DUF1836 domain-containing protein [Clostridium]ADK13246.1 conserved hypothetical protein [Clostridium ljungdahlii DSM 13528]AGY76473.1 DUF1836 domain-containing protein [Clostridium autoethanogenum DSM 10061]ALU36635.1 hypothetical protein CLAU_2207 [Clostridium autoethanogenum DSM 10061]OAA83695.1 hypothetical protein WX45_02035 [Clostridium ljungdahlii DSM 13528]OVY50675.1 hypothetical protein WX72_02753 [Clostridium autoethanogenum]
MKEHKFGMEYINKIAKNISDNTIVPYEDLPRYDLFLSQVTDYLNDKFQGEKYTNNIVQNYIKNEVISKPEDGKKRGYTKVHLTQLILLSYMRPILTTEEIKKVFRLAFNEINDGEDDIISWEKAYKIFSDLHNNSLDDLMSKEHFNEQKFQDMVKDMDLKSDDEERIGIFFVVMSLICQASAIKKLVQNIVNNYEGK